jgi:hypothetical protein
MGRRKKAGTGVKEKKGRKRGGGLRRKYRMNGENKKEEEDAGEYMRGRGKKNTWEGGRTEERRKEKEAVMEQCRKGKEEVLKQWRKEKQKVQEVWLKEEDENRKKWR